MTFRFLIFCRLRPPRGCKSWLVSLQCACTVHTYTGRGARTQAESCTYTSRGVHLHKQRRARTQAEAHVRKQRRARTQREACTYTSWGVHVHMQRRARTLQRRARTQTEACTYTNRSVHVHKQRRAFPQTEACMYTCGGVHVHKQRCARTQAEACTYTPETFTYTIRGVHVHKQKRARTQAKEHTYTSRGAVLDRTLALITPINNCVYFWNIYILYISGPVYDVFRCISGAVHPPYPHVYGTDTDEGTQIADAHVDERMIYLPQTPMRKQIR